MAHHLSSAFEEAASYSQYHPSKGYWWRFPNGPPGGRKDEAKAADKRKASSAEEPSSLFQRQRVDNLLAEWTKRFPAKVGHVVSKVGHVVSVGCGPKKRKRTLDKSPSEKNYQF